MPAPAQTLADDEEITFTTAVMDEQNFRDAISDLESTQGAYAHGLSEHLLSLGLALQAQDRHPEAVDLFKRGVHLARINEGLYSEEQVALLQGEIASHIALGEYSEADNRQRYMYRVQVRNMRDGQSHAMAFMQQANWQFNAYQLRLGTQGFSRLMNMWDLYRAALNDIIAQQGEGSYQLIKPLRGMLQALYLISGYDAQSETASFNSADDLGARQDLNRFHAYRAQSYDRGGNVIKAIYDLEKGREGGAVDAAQALIMLGDWQLWHDEHQDAWETYQHAIMELAETDDAQLNTDLLLGAPRALPDFNGVRPLPAAVPPEQADILLQFGVNEKGRVIDLDRIDEIEHSKTKGHSLMRRLRKTTFRPRFEAGQRVRTDSIVKAYTIE